MQRPEVLIRDKDYRFRPVVKKAVTIFTALAEVQQASTLPLPQSGIYVSNKGSARIELTQYVYVLRLDAVGQGAAGLMSGMTTALSALEELGRLGHEEHAAKDYCLGSISAPRRAIPANRR